MEYQQIVNTNRQGDFVLENQGGSEGFKNVSQYWLPKTKTYEQVKNELNVQRKNRVDITAPWKSWKFTVEENKLKMEYEDGRKFVPTEYALLQAADWAEIKGAHIKGVLSTNPDENDLNQLCDTLNYRKQRYEYDGGEQRKLFFRTYKDDTLRAVLTTSYAPIDNLWFLEVFEHLIPDGRVSHYRGDADLLLANILIPFCIS